MNDARDPRNRLLAETLHGEWNDGPPAAMARRAAAAVRRRRRLRATAAVAAVAAVVMMAVVVFRHADAPRAAESRGALAKVTTPAATTPVAKADYDIISDDELLWLVHDRPLLVLPEDNGAKKIVVLEN